MLRAVHSIGKTPLEVSCIKATWKDEFIPKEKHVQAIIQFVRTRNYESEILPMVQQFLERLASSSSITVLKTLIIIHRLLRIDDKRVSTRFARSFIPKANVLNKLNIHFNDSSSSVSQIESKFVRSYSKFLYEKLLCFQKFDEMFLENKICENGIKLVESQDIELSLEASTLIDKLLGVYVVKCDFDSIDEIYSLSASALTILAKDSIRLYTVYSMIIFHLLDSFDKIPLKIFERSLNVFRNFRKTANSKYRTQITKIISDQNVFPSSNCSSGDKTEQSLLPSFDVLPDSLIDKLEDYLHKFRQNPSLYNEASLVPTLIPHKSNINVTQASSSQIKPQLIDKSLNQSKQFDSKNNDELIISPFFEPVHTDNISEQVESIQEQNKSQDFELDKANNNENFQTSVKEDINPDFAANFEKNFDDSHDKFENLGNLDFKAETTSIDDPFASNY